MDSVSYAKISSPRLTGIYQRVRLFQLIDAAADVPLIWVSGPPGAGKTTLVGSYLESRQIKKVWYQIDEGDSDVATFFYYMGLAAKKATPRKRKQLPLLTPEYQLGVPTFTRNYFRELYSRFTKPFVFVFDNYQDATSETELHKLIAIGLEQLPEGGRAIIISREDPPSEFIRLRANGQLIVINWDQLKLTRKETSEILLLKGISNRPINNIIEITHGWMAGLVLLFEHNSKESWSPVNTEFNHELLFDYFAGEIFNRSEEYIKKFLIKTALFPKMTVQMAVQLTGLQESVAILEALVNKNYFTYRHGGKNRIYEYHPLFREFLIEKSVEISSNVELTVTKWNAAELLEQDNQTDSAIQLLEQVADWEKLAALIKNTAKNLLNHGRHNTLKDWLAKIPETEFVSDPWLLYWYGECRIESSPAESISAYEKAFRLFEIQEDVSGIFLAWAGIVESIRRDHTGDARLLDPWFVVLDELREKYPEYPSVNVEIQVASSMFAALWWRMPQHQDLFLWRKHILNVADLIPQGLKFKLMGNMIMAFYLLFTGKLAKAKYLIDACQNDLPKGYVNPHTRMWIYVGNSLYYWRTGEYEQAFTYVSNGLEFAEKVGSTIENYQLCAIGVSAALTIEDMDLAEKYIQLSDYSDHGIKGSRYHFTNSWYAYVMGDLDKARVYAEKSVDLADASGAPFFIGLAHHGLACVLFAQGERQKAYAELSRLSDVATEIKSDLLIYAKTMTAAVFAFEEGDSKEGMKQLARGLALGRDSGLIGTSFVKKSQMMDMCIKALEAGIEIDHVVSTIKKMNLAPDKPPLHLDNWPWPVQIFSLGECEIMKDQQIIQFSRKTQKMPIFLVKALLAFGSHKVPEEKIIEALWPDAEGDAGHQALATTLHRVRKLLGNDAIIVHEGRLTLNSSYCWVDVWAFEHILNEVDKLPKENQTERGKLIEKALTLYKGQFLKEIVDNVWVISMREKLRNKFIRYLEEYGLILEKNEHWPDAIEWYQKGLEIDLLAEQFYQHLMYCFEQLDRKSDAVETYRQCHRILTTSLDVEPSRKTKEIYARVRA